MSGASAAPPEREAIVVGYGVEYLLMAINCGRSIRASNPEILRTLVTNLAVDASALSDAFDRVIVRDEPADQNRLVKTSILDHAVGESILYVDADSEVVGDLDPAFRLLDRFDVGLKAHAGPVNKPFELAPGIPGQTFTHFSGGMVLLRNGPAARDFLAHWQRRMIESGLSRDQPALARTVYDLPELRLITLGPVWNADEREVTALFDARKHELPRIRHYARPHLDPDVARRLAASVPGLVAALASTARADPDVGRVREKYRRITNPLFRIPLTRRPYLAITHRWGRLRGRPDVDVLDRRSRVVGRPYTRGAGRLWED